MRALESVDVYARDTDGHFTNTEVGEQFRTDVAESMSGWAMYVGRPYYRQVWGGLLDSVRTGDNAFRTIHGSSPWEYRRDLPEERAIFDSAMTATAAVVIEAVLAAYDFGRFDTIADIGGGAGTLLAAILQHNPSVNGILFDQAAVVADAEPMLETAGLRDRCRTVSGDFFASVPTGADALLLKAIIHDWLDDQAIQILRVCRRSMKEGDTLLLVEQLIGEGPDPAQTAFSDLNMLVSPGGQERTLEEYDALLVAAGFTTAPAVETTTPVFVIEAAAS
jgi:hypothetical protein